jgi:hypothetical protein
MSDILIAAVHQVRQYARALVAVRTLPPLFVVLGVGDRLFLFAVPLTPAMPVTEVALPGAPRAMVVYTLVVPDTTRVLDAPARVVTPTLATLSAMATAPAAHTMPAPPVLDKPLPVPPVVAMTPAPAEPLQRLVHALQQTMPKERGTKRPRSDASPTLDDEVSTSDATRRQVDRTCSVCGTLFKQAVNSTGRICLDCRKERKRQRREEVAPHTSTMEATQVPHV